jgi:hypothetical protein
MGIVLLLMKINIMSTCLFPYIKDKGTMDARLNHRDDLPAELLSKTNWKDFKEPIVGMLIPDLLITYFGQVLPHGDISDDEIKAKLIIWAMDMNYEPTLPMMTSRHWTISLVS